jgi:hypothetical protein
MAIFMHFPPWGGRSRRRKSELILQALERHQADAPMLVEPGYFFSPQSVISALQAVAWLSSMMV